jgi:glutamate dehydrogenase (NAD(P)+)
MTTHAEFDSTLYRTAVAQLDEVAKKVDLEPDLHERLRHPRRALVASVPVRMDTHARGPTRRGRLPHARSLPIERGRSDVA